MSTSTIDRAYLAKDAYQDRSNLAVSRRPLVINGHQYFVLDYVSTSTGYAATAYQRKDTGEVIIAERGTEPRVSDAVADFRMVRDQTNIQWPDAESFARRVIDKAKWTEPYYGHPIDVSVTGHSLGGTLAELTSATFGLKGETFNSYGAVDLAYGVRPDSAQVVNHVLAGDVVSAASGHVGTVRTYATEADLASLRVGRYLGAPAGASPANPLLAMRLSDHGIDQFAPESGRGESVLTAANESRYEQHFAAIEHYRGDVLRERAELGDALRRSDSGTIASTLAQLSPRMRQQLLELHANLVDAPLHAAVEHNRAVRGLEQALAWTSATLHAGGQQWGEGAERSAQRLHAAGADARQLSDGISRNALALAPADPVGAVGAVGLAVGITAAGHIAQAQAEHYAQATRFAGQTLRGVSDLAAAAASNTERRVEQGARAAGVAVAADVHLGELATGWLADRLIAAHAAARHTASRVVEGVEQTVAHGHGLLADADHWLHSPGAPSRRPAPAHDMAGTDPRSTRIGTRPPSAGKADPREPDSPLHPLYQRLHHRIPQAPEERLVQFAAACHAHGITERNLDRIHLDEAAGKIHFVSSGLPLRIASIDLQGPMPAPEHATEQIRLHDPQSVPMVPRQHVQLAPAHP